MTKKDYQNESAMNWLKEYLQQGRKIDARTFYEKTWVQYLPSYINVLRNKDWVIADKEIPNKGRRPYKQYWLIEKPTDKK